MTERKISLGTGKDIKEGWEHQDIIPLPGINMCFDLNSKNWPIENNAYDVIECKMILEHLNNWPQAMEEIWRISKPNAKIYIEVPWFASMYQWIDPTHKVAFAYQTFEYFDPKHNLNYYTKARFKIIKRYIRFSWNKFINFIPAFIFNLLPVFYSRYWCFIFPSNSLEIELQTIK